jgi:hypothetical protein
VLKTWLPKKIVASVIYQLLAATLTIEMPEGFFPILELKMPLHSYLPRAAQRRPAPDREQRGFHPQDLDACLVACAAGDAGR